MKFFKKLIQLSNIKLPHILVIGFLISALALFSSLVVIPAASPATGAEIADLLRAGLGPQPVSQLESLSNWMRDEVNRVRFGSQHEGPQISWSGGSPAIPGNTANSGARLAPVSASKNPRVSGTDVVTAAPQIGWQAYGPAVNGAPQLARTMVLLDPQRSYAGVALVRIDLSQLSLHMMPGFIEPAHPSGISRVIPNSGTIPPQDQGSLVAAFNGGFKAIHGHYGMMVNGLTLLPPIDGMATVAVYRDGHVQIGAWNRDILPSPDIVAFRQNCPPLIEAGQLNPALINNSSKEWGFTHNTDITWRTGLGITQDGRYLLYAVGNGTNAEFLAEALQKAGAYMAMQLDINQYYAEFVTYSHSSNSSSAQPGQLVSEPLLDQMTSDPQLYLIPHVRDFFYLTTH